MNCPRCSAPTEDQTLREFGGVCPKCLLDFSEEQDAPAFPNLEILEILGQGGMGVVYKAKQKNLDRIVALKVLSPQLSDDPEFVERFTREAKALATLSHPNIVGIHDSGIHDRVPYLVMEYIDGTPLRKMLTSGKLTPDRALEVIPQICDALQYAHTHGVIHRDIKPENILIDRQGRVKIADFGLAKLSKVDETRITQSGYVMGTPRYMAPEQFEASGRVDHRADIYSLGVVFYEMLTGEVPMGRFKPPSEKSDVDRRLDPVVLKSLEREPEDRYQSAGEVKAQVAGFKHVPAPPAPAATKPSHPLKKAARVILWMGCIALAAWYPGYAAGIPVFPKVLLPVGGSLLLAAGVLWLLSHVFRSSEPDPGVRKEGIQIAGCLIALMLMIGGVILVFLLLTVRSEAPLAVPAPAATQRSTKGFRIADAWPTQNSLPEHLGMAVVDPAKAKEELALDAGMLGDIREIRRWRIFHEDERGDPECVLTGIEFKSEAAREKWADTIRMPGARSRYVHGVSLLCMQHEESETATRLYRRLTELVQENVRAALALEEARRMER